MSTLKSILLPDLPEISDESQKLMKGGYTIETVSCYEEYPDYDDFYDNLPSDSDPNYGGGGGGGVGPGDSGNDDHDDHEEEDDDKVCTCAANIMDDMADGSLSADSANDISNAASAVGIGSGFGDLTFGTLDAFADALNLTASSGGKVISGISKGMGVVGLVSNATALVVAIGEDGLDADDWDEIAGTALAVIGIAGAILSAPAWLTVGAAGAGIVVSVAALAGLGQDDDNNSVGDTSVGDTSVDNSCPIHG